MSLPSGSTHSGPKWNQNQGSENFIQNPTDVRKTVKNYESHLTQQYVVCQPACSDNNIYLCQEHVRPEVLTGRLVVYGTTSISV